MNYISSIDEKWYAFEADRENGQVFSIGSDNPAEGGRWFAGFSANGVKYVAKASPSENAAYKKAKRYGRYGGIIKFN